MPRWTREDASTAMKMWEAGFRSKDIAMVLGRVAGGIATALFYLGTGEAFTLATFATSYFVTGLPGIIAHLVLVPALALTLTKAGVVPKRY